MFFSFVIDCYSRMVVGWQFAGHMRTELVQDALDMAVAARQPDPDALLIHHSDRASQYTSAQFNDALADHGVAGSLGSTGDAYDNALAEIVRRLLQDRADRRPPVAHTQRAGARDRRMGRLVQPPTPAQQLSMTSRLQSSKLYTTCGTF